LVILYEIHTIDRFERVQDFVSYCRLVKCQRESAGKSYGIGGAKIGNLYLRSAFGEAAVLFLRGNPPAQKWLEKKANQYNKAKALTILAHKLGRAVYFMLKRQKLFDQDQFLASA
jgi:transposase